MPVKVSVHRARRTRNVVQMKRQRHQAQADRYLVAGVSLATTGLFLAVAAVLGRRIFNGHPVQLTLFVCLVLLAAATFVGVLLPHIKDLFRSSRRR
ncbi:MAG TPA: hypothetical protein VFA70_08985 [Dehalococcoidia bacterium]|nr:hypothetical protein [Dehalococcoidia bacterium]